ncbi:MAG: hypothetical protein HY335_00640 [Deinococcus sp.]|nr:hypothetical protein [Deinococcus sp.]
MELIFGKGIDKMGDLLGLASELGVVIKSGSWLSFQDTRLGQGKEKAGEFLASNPEIAQAIKQAVLAQAKTTRRPANGSSSNDSEPGEEG